MWHLFSRKKKRRRQQHDRRILIADDGSLSVNSPGRRRDVVMLVNAATREVSALPRAMLGKAAPVLDAEPREVGAVKPNGRALDLSSGTIAADDDALRS